MRPIFLKYMLMVLLSALHPCLGAAQETEDPLMAALKTKGGMLLCGEPVPLELPQVMERFEKEMLLSLGGRAQVILWLKRSARYFPYIERMLKEKNLPDDIKYLAVAESALLVYTGSSKGAMGIWQIMPQTARKLGLVVDRNIDERRNIYLSSPAAMDYLSMLYGQFGSWSLALAAYNMGEEGLKAQILEQETDDYYRLYLSQETQRFIFRILAIKIILEAPGQYGFNLSPEDLYAPETFSTVQVEASAALPLRLIAAAAETDFKAIKELNPELQGHFLPAGTRRVNIPVGSDTEFQKRLTPLIEAESRTRSQRIYVVEKGDSLSVIAEKFHIPLAALLIWNQIDINKAIHPGQELVISQAVEQRDIHLQTGAMDADE